MGTANICPSEVCNGYRGLQNKYFHKQLLDFITLRATPFISWAKWQICIIEATGGGARFSLMFSDVFWYIMWKVIGIAIKTHWVIKIKFASKKTCTQGDKGVCRQCGKVLGLNNASLCPCYISASHPPHPCSRIRPSFHIFSSSC